jgi:hypothetical protein
LARLLQEEDHLTRILEAYPTGAVDELPEDVDFLLLTPGLSPDVRAAFLEAVSRNPKTAAVPVLSVSAALKVAMIDELAVSASCQSLFEELDVQIGAALTRAAASARALVVDCGEPAG